MRLTSLSFGSPVLRANGSAGTIHTIPLLCNRHFPPFFSADSILSDILSASRHESDRVQTDTKIRAVSPNPEVTIGNVIRGNPGESLPVGTLFSSYAGTEKLFQNAYSASLSVVSIAS